MRLLGTLSWAWVLGSLAARLGDAAPLTARVSACVIGVLGLILIRRRGPRLGLSLFAAAVACLVTPPIATNTPALLDGSAWALLADVDGVARQPGDRSVLPVEVTQARLRNGYAPVSGRFLLSAPALREPVGPGDRLFLRGRLAPPGRSCNPGDCDGAWRAAAQGLQGSLWVPQAELVVRLDARAPGLRGALWRVRLALQRAIDARLPVEEAALVSALVLGDRRGLSRSTEQAFRSVGITHLLSVSGLHLAFAAGLLFSLLRRALAWVAPGLGARRPRDRIAALAAAPIVVCYALLTGAEVATLRAAFVVVYAFFALVLSRRLRGLDALAFAALALLVPSPARLFDVSFQLSFVAALATLLGVPRAAAIPREAGPLAALRRLARAAVQLVRVSLAATITTAPLTASWFSEIAPMGVLSNVVAVPLSELLLVPLGIVGAGLEALLSPLGLLPLHLSGFCAYSLLGLVRLVAPLSPVLAVAAPSSLVLFACAAGLVHLAGAPGLRRLLVAAALVLAVASGEWLWGWLHPELEICFLDVGQGDAAVVLAPDGSAVVIDGGPDLEAHALLGFLRRRGVRRIALVVLSHPHPDHAGGLAALVAALPVEALWTTDQRNADAASAALLSSARAHSVPQPTPAPWRRGGLLIRPLLPRDPEGALRSDPLESENDNSLVLELAYAGRRVLFAGDLEAAGEAALVRTGPGRYDVLKVPHHGSRTSSSAALLAALRPRAAVASLAAGNRYRFPHPDVLARYRALGVPLYRTDRDGAVSLRIDAGGHLELTCARPGGCLAN